MKRLMAGDPSDVAALRDLLAEHGIAAHVLDEDTARRRGALPFRLPVAELWIDREEDEARAAPIVARYLSESRRAVRRPPWKCPQCGQIIGGQFTECWNCALNDEEDDPRRDPEARCDECGYRLYGLPERRCPECGTEF